MLVAISPENQVFTGFNRFEIVRQIFQYSFNEKRQLVFKSKYHYLRISDNSWSKEYSDSELQTEAIDYLWKVLKDRDAFILCKELD